MLFDKIEFIIILCFFNFYKPRCCAYKKTWFLTSNGRTKAANVVWKPPFQEGCFPIKHVRFSDRRAPGYNCGKRHHASAFERPATTDS